MPNWQISSFLWCYVIKVKSFLILGQWHRYIFCKFKKKSLFDINNAFDNVLTIYSESCRICVSLSNWADSEAFEKSIFIFLGVPPFPSSPKNHPTIQKSSSFFITKNNLWEGTSNLLFRKKSLKVRADPLFSYRGAAILKFVKL